MHKRMENNGRESIRGCVQHMRMLQRGEQMAEKKRGKRRSAKTEASRWLKAAVRQPKDVTVKAAPKVTNVDENEIKDGKPVGQLLEHKLLTWLKHGNVTLSLRWHHKALRAPPAVIHTLATAAMSFRWSPLKLMMYLHRKGYEILLQCLWIYIISPPKLIRNAAIESHICVELKKQPWLDLKS